MANKYSHGGGQLRKTNPLYKDIKEINIIMVILMGLVLIGISGYTSYAIFSSEVESSNLIRGTVKELKVPQDKSGANEPVLTDNMIPVYFDETTNEWKKADKDNMTKRYKWYDYDAKMWANAVTVTSTNRQAYLDASAGTTIPMSDINTMFVWIPRYKYTYFESATPVEVPITFESGTTKTGTISCTDAIANGTLKSENCTDATNGTITKGKSTYTHPAFTFGSDELTGLWVGKFENSNGATVQIKPSVQSTRSITVSAMFQNARNMELPNNTYGFPQTGTTLNQYTGAITGDSNNIDTHMLKNMEWGAITYLSHSKYGTCDNGTCTEVAINNNSSFYTGGGNAAISYVTNKNQSTTKNVYGIYDMSGGAFEYVMANEQNASNNFSPSLAGTWSSTNKPLDKYYDKYTYGDSYEEYSRGKLGDATKETVPTVSSHTTWYNDSAGVVNSSYSWFPRGGYYGDGSSAGLFYFNRYDGDDFYYYGSRSALAVVVR